MKKTKSILAVIMIMIATLFVATSCCNNCKKDGEKCEKASCCKDEKCCDKCSDECTTENKCCDKCKVGEEKACCKKDEKMDSTHAKECCKKDSTEHENH